MLGKLRTQFMTNGGDDVKRLIILGSIMSVFVILLCACNSVDFNNQLSSNDWSYELPNDYVIWHINSRKIVCGKKNTEHSITNVVGDYIIKFCYNDQYVCMQCVEVSNNLLEDIDESNSRFYILDTINEDVYGPLLEQEFKEMINILKADNLSAWIPTKPKPDGAKIP